MADYSFKPSWWASVLFVAGFALFNALAVWQLSRAEEKRHLIELRQQHEQEPPIHLIESSSIDPQSMRYRPVMLEGEYDIEHPLLVDTPVHDQLPGYHVLTPLRLDEPGLMCG